jgi:uncharacterized protein with FMN-binding domain
MRKTLTAIACSAALTVSAGSAWAATSANAAQKKKVVTVAKSVVSPVVDVSRWGQLEVKVKLTLTTTTVAGKATKSFKITGVSFPIYPQHTDRSAYISQQALPLLRQEVLQIKGSSIKLVSGATDTSYAFVQALQGALAKAGA